MFFLPQVTDGKSRYRKIEESHHLFPDKRYEWIEALSEAYELHDGGAAALDAKLKEIENTQIPHLEKELNERIFAEVKHELEDSCGLEFKGSETKVEMGDKDLKQHMVQRFVDTTWKRLVDRHRKSEPQTIGDLVQEKNLNQAFLQLSGEVLSTDQLFLNFQFFLPSGSVRHKGYELGFVHLCGKSDWTMFE
jgi:hypothetical protein